MATKTIKKRKETSPEAMIKIPLSSLRCLQSFPKENKIICEIDVESMERVNKPNSLDEIINESRLDYALGDYKTFSNATDLIAELRA